MRTRTIDSAFEELKNILGSSYYDYLVNLINNNYNLDVNKPFNEIVNDVFDAYRRASISLDDNKKNRLNIIIDGLCKAAYKREFDFCVWYKDNCINPCNSWFNFYVCCCFCGCGCNNIMYFKYS